MKISFLLFLLWLPFLESRNPKTADRAKGSTSGSDVVLDCNTDYVGGNSFEELLCLKSPTPSSKFLLENLKDFEKILNIFYSKLQMFMNGTAFDSEGFAIAEESLVQDFAILETLVNLFLSFIKALLERFHFAKSTFEAMTGFSQDLRKSKASNEPGLCLVWSMKDLNLRLLQLRDSRGRPDPSIHEFTAKLALRAEHFEFLSGLAKGFSDMSENTKNLFQEQMSSALSSLEELKQYVPKGS